MVHPNKTTNEAVDIMLRHGVALLPNLLQPDTATALRDYILMENKRTSQLINVIENEHRWSFPLQIDRRNPAVLNAVTQVLNHGPLVDLLQALAGTDPAVIEFTAITAAYGAKSQSWHQDGTSTTPTCVSSL
jgi:hypothetical protein